MHDFKYVLGKKSRVKIHRLISSGRLHLHVMAFANVALYKTLLSVAKHNTFTRSQTADKPEIMLIKTQARLRLCYHKKMFGILDMMG